MDEIERAAVAAEGYDPDDPDVVAALARLSAVLAELGRHKFGHIEFGGTRDPTTSGVNFGTCRMSR